MNRILLAASFLIAQFSARAQQPAPLIERTESIIYEKRVTEKRVANPDLPGPPVSENASSAVVATPVPEPAVPVISSPPGPALAPQAAYPAPTAAPDEIRQLRRLIEAQGQKIDSIRQEIARQKQAVMAPQDPHHPAAPSQAPKRDNISVGVYMGPNLSAYSTDQDSLGSRARVGYQFGLYVRGGGRLFGQLGAEYVGISSRRYSKDDKGTSLKQLNSTINTHYIQVPLQIGYRPLMTQSRRTGIRIQAGAELSYLLQADKNDFKLTDEDYNQTVINLLGGIGFDLGPITLDISYHHGIRDVYRAENAKLRMVGASLGFKF
ncbi:outer membrane protein with beta-barrel domain [Larkinella arboricola]|uniref:Outer membrane protein with beta-barrel domain n=1 Tax=Larkinella arboricola TaxID=643671 RepID=A0A327X276_LARAB|nr:porin family protein [Larkinella arboricola]RAK00508.1 outer membrane protein with beta-barrel domain [Larkinella arboricola]